MKKVIIATLLALSLVVAFGGSLAYAADCFNANKPDGAGNFGALYIGGPLHNAGTGPTNPGGQTQGGFIDVYVWIAGPDFYQQVADDTFALPGAPGLPSDHPGAGTLPEGALHAAGDGQGVDVVH
jgi:hypothetical protein